MTATRPIYLIAEDIKVNWPRMHPAAVPYWKVMMTLTDITDVYIAEPAKTIVLYFLSNSASWRGEHARRIKTELKDMVK
jgi:hypothetical protein